MLVKQRIPALVNYLQRFRKMISTPRRQCKRQWSKKYGNTADFAAAHGEDIEDTQFVLGIRAWF